MKPRTLTPRILITCEHASFKVPAFIKSEIPTVYKKLMQSQNHQTFDKKALDVATLLRLNLMSQGFKTDVISYPFTRLILDANRTPNKPGFQSKLAPFLADKELIQTKLHYQKYFKKCENWIARNINDSPLYIFSIHSFVPVFKNKVRKTEIGLLFRNTIQKEKKLAQLLKKNLTEPSTKIHFNLPYRGSTDCFLNTHLDLHLKNPYINGLFFEFNQKYLNKNLDEKIKTLALAITKTLDTI